MKKLLILSGKGGTGKTTVAAAFVDFLSAKAFADCDVDAPNLHLVTNVQGRPEICDYYGSQKAYIDPNKCSFCGLCMSQCRFDAITQLDGTYIVNEFSCEGCGICEFVCPTGAVMLRDDIAGEQMLYCGSPVFSTAKLKMGRGNSGKLVTAVKTALFKHTEAADIAVIDGSPGIGCPVIASVSGVDLVLIVAEPSVSGIHDMKRIVETAEILRAKAAVCVNKYDVCTENTEAIERFCAENGIPFAGRIPYDRQASAAINAGHSLASVACPARESLYAVFKRTRELLRAE